MRINGNQSQLIQVADSTLESQKTKELEFQQEILNELKKLNDNFIEAFETR